MKSGLFIASLALSAGAVWGVERTPLEIPQTGRAGFAVLEPAQTGILFTNTLAQERYTTNQIYLNGSGVAAGDIDGDGRCDLFFAGISGTSALYRNAGNFHFENITGGALPPLAALSATGAALADLDGDGDLDLVVNSVGSGTHIFLNDGQGHFTRAQVLNEGKGGMSLALADYDGDGALDLYICNYRTSTLRDLPGTNFRINMVNGRPVVASINGEPASLPKYEGRYALNSSGNISEFGEADAFYRNDGRGHFLPVSFTDGNFLDEQGQPLRSPPYDWSLSVMFRDLNEDGLPDLYVCSDFDTPDRIWINQGNGRFKALAPLALRNTSRFSMGIDVADINRDGHDDLFVLDMLSQNHAIRLTRADKNMDSAAAGVIEFRPQFGRNTLQLNRGDGTFAEIAYFAGLEASEWSWTPIFIDVDLDGYEDLLISTGHGRDDMDIDNGLRIERTRRTTKMAPLAELSMRKTSPALPSRQAAFRNTGQLRFENASAAWGFERMGVAHGMCLADLDGDGDLDVAVNNLNAAASLYRNESAAPRLAVQLAGSGANRSGIGAKIKVSGGALPRQTESVICGGRYLSSDEPLRVFAAGSVTNRLEVEVTWPGGARSIVKDVPANSRITVTEAGAEAARPGGKNPVRPLFEDASGALQHQHAEDAFDDFARQALLPKRLSQLGPAAAWIDLDGKGRDDLVIGSGRGGRVALYRNQGDGKFVRDEQSPLTKSVSRDTAGILGYSQANGAAAVLAGFSNYEDAQTNGTAVALYPGGQAEPEPVAALQNSSIGPLALGDIDADGTLELFAGGRMVAGSYPMPASSRILQRAGGGWQEHPATALLKEAGLVSGAVFSDLNGDGFPELILACEWGPIKVFWNERGTLRDATMQLGLEKATGWWNGVAAGDFDNDGRMDLAASNWGLNSKYRVAGGRGPRIYWGNWGGAGEVEPIEAEYDAAMNDWVPLRDLNTVGRAIPLLREVFHTHRSFAEATMGRVLGERLKSARIDEAACLETSIFLNRGDHFERRALPAEAQFSPAFGISVADFDGDGNEDIFLSQNFFDVATATSRYDAGRGLLLKGGGKGDFEPVEGARSGIKIYGEQRSCAVADYDDDGRPDLVVTQNSAATTLWHNVGAKPGLRVRFKSGAIGAAVRIGYAEGSRGPAREIHAGSGYWSQDSQIQVLGLRAAPASLEVLWPGGRRSTVPLKEGLREVTIDSSTR